MKKMFVTVVSVLLAVSMLLCFTACDGAGDSGSSAAKKEDTVVGKWEATIDTTDIVDAMTAELGMEIEIETALKVFFEFTADGKSTIEFDTDSVNAFAEELTEDMVSAVCEAMGMTADDYYALAGMTKEEFVSSMKDSMTSEMALAEGTYEIEDNKLWILEEGDVKEDEDAVIFSFEDGNLIFDVAEGEDTPEDFEGMLPMTLTRVE